MKLDEIIKKARELHGPIASPTERAFVSRTSIRATRAGSRRKTSRRPRRRCRPAYRRCQGCRTCSTRRSLGVLLISRRWTRRVRMGPSATVMSGVIRGLPGCVIQAPSVEELDHDYLWRCNKNLPNVPHRDLQPLLLRRGSGRARASGVAFQGAAPARSDYKDIWDDRFRDIRGFERYLSNNVSDPEVFSARIAQRAEAPLHRTDRQPGDELEILRRRCAQRRILEGVQCRLRGCGRETATKDSA